MHGYPRRLYHNVPNWVEDGSLFHIRIRVAPAEANFLTKQAIALPLLESAKSFHAAGIWWCVLFLLMPDHLHALLAFPPNRGMSATVGNWKRFTARNPGISWQSNYFDHRIRNEAAAAEKWRYIQRNPVVKNLVANEEEWPWKWSPFADGGARSPSALRDSAATEDSSEGRTL